MVTTQRQQQQQGQITENMEVEKRMRTKNNSNVIIQVVEKFSQIFIRMLKEERICSNTAKTTVVGVTTKTTAKTI